MADGPTREERRAARAAWPVKAFRLGDEPRESENLEFVTTADERLAMVWRLTRDAWASSGRPYPAYTRDQTPGRIIRPRHD